uniref:Syntaxin-61 n=1 Tax=Noccaea caerulescens TaxID=107243 RepID=A0A1J3I9E6_NOCCA
MTTSLDRWEKDPFFSAAEEVQESADRMESAYRTWILKKQDSSNVWDSEQLHRDLHAALGTTKWQLDEFHRAVQSSYDNRLSDDTRDRHREFTFAMETQVAKIEKSLKEAAQSDGKGTPRWVRLDEDDRNELALFLTGPCDSEKKQLPTNGVKLNQLQEPYGHRRTASASAWNIAVSDDGLLQKPPTDEPPVRPPRKVPSVSGFLNYMEPGSKNCIRKWKALDRQGDSDAMLLPVQANQQVMNGCFERDKSCMEECYEKQLHGWYGALQRQLQRSQYRMRYSSKSVQAAIWILLLIFLIVVVAMHTM